MITIIDQPNLHSFTKNDIRFVVETDNYITNQGRPARNFYKLLNYLSDGDTISIEFTDENGQQYDLTFTAQDNPAMGQLELPTENTAPLSLPDYNQLLVQFLMGHPIFSAYFHSETGTIGGDQSFYIEFKLPDAFNVTNTVTVSSTLELVVAESYVPKQYRENFKIVAEIFSNFGDSFTKVAQLEAVPDTNQTATILIDEVIDDEILSEILSWPLSESQILLISSFSGKYFLRLYEYYGETPSLQGDYTTSDVLIAKLGGQYIKDYHESVSYFLSDQPYFSAFLTPLQDVLYVQPNQRYWLTIYKTAENYEISVKFYNRTGTTADYVIGNVINESPLQNYLQLECGFDYLVQLLGVPRPINYIKYDVIVKTKDGSSAIINTYRYSFLVDRTNYEFVKDIYFINRYGALDGIRITGINELELETERFAAISITQSAEAPITGFEFQFGHRSKNMVSARSGTLISKLNIEAMQDLMHSDFVWLLKNNKWIPLSLKDKKFKVTEDGKNVQELSFKYTYNINAIDY